VHLSTSNSNERLPSGHWGVIWLCSLTFWAAFVFYFEVKIRNLGWEPSVIDSKELWAKHRQLASELGKRAIVLVGESRMQLDIDLEVVKEMTKLEPVQLAIDGSPFMPVLEDIADDESVNGVIVVSVTEHQVNTLHEESKATEWVRYYHNEMKIGSEPYRDIDNKIKALIDENLVTHLEGAKPATVISTIGSQNSVTGNYLTTDKNRSRNADYKKVQMPDFYAARVQRHFGRNVANPQIRSIDDFIKAYEDILDTLQSGSNQEFVKGTNLLIHYVKKIEDRGGKVILIRFPSDKLIWKMDEKSYPKENFWHEVEKRHNKTIFFKDYYSLSQFDLPDGSHLDFRDKYEFTHNLIQILLNKKYL